MKIRYTRHAKARMRLWKITREEVMRVLAAPERKEIISINRFHYFRAMGERNIGVTFALEKEQYIIISVVDRSDSMNDMKIEYDHQADAVYLYLSSHRGRVWKSREIEEGIIVDLNKKKEVIGIELLDVSRRFKPTELFQFSVKHIEQPVLARVR